MKKINYWEHFRKNWKWRSYYDKDENLLPSPIDRTLEEMETSHIIRCMLYAIANNHAVNTNNMSVFLTELLYRDEHGI